MKTKKILSIISIASLLAMGINILPNINNAISVSAAETEPYVTDFEWTEGTSEGFNEGERIEETAYGNGKYVGIGRKGSGDFFLAYSTDGVHWVKGKYTGSWIYSLCFANNKFFYRDSDSNDDVFCSEDGVNWTKCLGLDTGNTDNTNYSSITYGNGKYVAVGTGDKFYNKLCAYSEDGINWTQCSYADNDMRLRDVIYANNKFVAVGYGNDKYSGCMYSEDGVNWQQGNGLNYSDSYDSLSYGNGKFIATTSKGKYAYSSDGINWTEKYAFQNDNYFSAFYNNHFIVFGNLRECYTSADGINWIQQSSLKKGISSLTYADNKFLFTSFDSTFGSFVDKNSIKKLSADKDVNVTFNQKDSIQLTLSTNKIDFEDVTGLTHSDSHTPEDLVTNVKSSLSYDLDIKANDNFKKTGETDLSVPISKLGVKVDAGDYTKFTEVNTPINLVSNAPATYTVGDDGQNYTLKFDLDSTIGYKAGTYEAPLTITATQK